MSAFYAITKTVLFRGNFRRSAKTALRISLPFLMALFAFQVLFSQEQKKGENIPNKPNVTELPAEPVKMKPSQNMNEGNTEAKKVKSPERIAFEKTLEAERAVSGDGVTKKISIDPTYEVYTNAKGEVWYRVMDGTKLIVNTHCMTSDNAELAKANAIAQAKSVAEAYKNCPACPIDEILYKAGTLQNPIYFDPVAAARTLANCTYTATMPSGTTGQTITGRIFRDGTPSTCAAPETCPAGTPFGAGTFNYFTLPITNTSAATECITVTVTTNTAGQQMHVVAYSGSFNPANQCQNYLADNGGSSLTGVPATFSFNLNAGATAVLVMYNPINGTASTAFTLNVNGNGVNCSANPAFAITGHPSNATACPGTNTTFTVVATSPLFTSVTYAWQEDRGTGFVYLANGGVYSGVTTPTLTLTGVTLAMNGWKYRCVLLLSSGGLPLISNEATLTVPPAPAPPAVSPTSAAICPGGVQPLSVTTVSAPTTQTTSSGAISVGIPDDDPAGTTHTIAVAGIPGGATISSISVNFNITHTWDSDLDINLVAPNGNIINLVSGRGGSGDNFTNTTISSASTTSLGTGSAPFTGTFAADAVINAGPSGFLSNVAAFSSLFSTPNGNWRLAIADFATGDAGTLTSWSISITYGAPLPGIWSPVTGLFTDAGLTTPYTAGTPLVTVYASPATTTTYSAVLNNGSCNSTPTNTTVTVNLPPAITGQPGNGSACVGTVKTLSVTATGAGLTYQWQVDQGGGFVNVSNTGVYTGATTPTLSINGVPNAFNGFVYRCIIGGTCPPALTSNSVTLVVNPLPVVAVSPSNQCSPVLLTAVGASTYSWSPADGLSATTGTTVTATTTVNTTYTVTGTVTATGCSNVADVLVIGTPRAPIITPPSATICLGSSQLLAVSPTTSFSNTGTITIPSSGNGTPYPSTITVSGLPTSGITVKSVTLNNVSHTWHDDIDVVLVSPAGVPVILMSDVGGSTNITPGRTYTFDDAAAAGMTTGNNPAGTYKPTNFTTPDNFPAPGPGSLSQTAPAITSFGSANHNGTWRLYVVDDVGGDQGTISGWTITFNLGGSTVNFSPVTGLFNDPGLTSAYTGNAVTQVYASPATTTTYNVSSGSTGPASNSTVNSSGGVITIPSSGPAGTYPAVIAVSGLPVTGVSVKSVTINGVSHTFPSDIDILLQSPTGQNVVLMSDIGGGLDINDVNYTFSDQAASVMSTTAFNPSGIYRPINNGATDTWAVPGPGSITQAAPTLSSFTGDPNGTWNLFVVDDAGGDVGAITSWSITFNVGTNTCTSPATLVTVTVHNPIVFTTQPQNVTVCQNGNATFTVAATGTVQTYQWQVSTNGGGTWTNIAGATSATLSLTNMQPVVPPAPNRRYRCLLGSVGCGSSASSEATLIVNPLPTVSLSASGQLQLRPGMLTTITVSSSPAGASYQWFVNGVLQPGISGSSYVADAYHLGTYTVRVTDVNGCVNTTDGITLSALASDNLFVYPNPTSGAYFVTFYMPNAGTPVTINVIDMKGRKLITRQATTTAPYTRFDFDAGNLAAGVYIIEFRDSGGDRLGTGRLVVNR